jgi:hypothetical protein
MCKEGKTCLYYMPMFVLCRTILLVGMWTGHSVRDAYIVKEGMEFLTLPPPHPQLVWTFLIFFSRACSNLAWNR